MIYVVLSVVAGAAWIMLLYLLWRIKSILEDLLAKSLGLPLTKSQIGAIVRHSKNYAHESDTIVIFPHNFAKSPLVTLDGNPYVNLKLFQYYYAVHGDEYILQFPDTRPVVLERMDEYFPGVDLFSHEGQLYVRTDKLGLKMKIEEDKIVWGTKTNGNGEEA